MHGSFCFFEELALDVFFFIFSSGTEVRGIQVRGRVFCGTGLDERETLLSVYCGRRAMLSLKGRGRTYTLRHLTQGELYLNHDV
jgi:hypothetical protein